MKKIILIIIILLSLFAPITYSITPHTSNSKKTPAPTQLELAPHQNDQLLLQNLFNKTGYIIYKASPTFKVVNGTPEIYITTGARKGSYFYLYIYTINGTPVTYLAPGSYYVAGISHPTSTKTLFIITRNSNLYYFDTDTMEFSQKYLQYSIVGYMAKTPSEAYVVLQSGYTKLLFYRHTQAWELLFSVDLAYDTYIYPENKILPMDINSSENIVMIAYDRRYRDSTDGNIYLLLINPEDGSIINTYTYNTGDALEADYATTAREGYDTTLADMAYPWYAGVGLKFYKLYTFNAETGQWRSFDIKTLYGNLTNIRLELVRVNGQVLVLLAGLNQSETPYIPELFLIDPSSGSVVEHIRLDGFPTTNMAIDVGRYGGLDVVYVGVQNYIIVMDLESLSIIGVKPTRVATVYAVDYDSYQGIELLTVAGLNADSSYYTEIYSIGGIATATRAFLTGDTTGYTDKPVNISIRLRTHAGQPIEGATVLVEELTESGWTPVASLVTDSQGYANGTILLSERGVHVLRAHYPGSNDYTASYSRPLTVTVYDRASILVETVPDTTIEGVPVNAIVTLQKLGGEALAGVWVSVLANISNTWVLVGTGMTNAMGIATIPLNLPAGNYEISAIVASPYISVEQMQNATLKVYPPLEPPPEGPYVAPAGRILAFSPPMAEKGKPAAVVFAFYYGENVVEPSDYSVTVTPSAPYTVETVEPGVYRVVLTPSSTGIYTVVFHAEYNYVSYVGAASFYVYDVAERVEAWNNSIMTLIERLENVNETLTRYLENITAALEDLNMTGLMSMVEKVNNNTIVILSRTGMILTNITTTQTMILSNWQELRWLNTTLQQAYNNLYGNLNNITIIVSRNGQILAAINTSVANLASYLQRMNATITGTITTEAGNIYALVSTRTGSILMNLSVLESMLHELNSSMSLNMQNSTLKIITSIGNLTLKLDQALSTLDSIDGVITSINTTTNNILVTVRTAKDLVTAKLDNLNPRIQAIYDETIALNTTLGTILLNLTALGDKATILLSTVQALQTNLNMTSQQIQQITGTLRDIQSTLDQIQQQLQSAPTQQALQQAQDTANSAKNLATAATALGTIGTALGALTLIRRP